MPIDYACPECKQPLQVPEDYLGRAIACPACKHVFRVGAAPAPPPAPLPPPPRDDYDDRRRRDDDRDRRRRDEDDDDRRRRRDDDDWDDRDRDRDFWRAKADTAGTLGLLSCVLCFIPIVGLILGIIACNQGGHRVREVSTRVRFENAKNLGVTGIILSSILFLGCCMYNFSMVAGRM